MAKMRSKDTEISFVVSEDEYQEANQMAKVKGYSSVEKLMKSKYEKFLKIYRNENDGGKERWQ